MIIIKIGGGKDINLEGIASSLDLFGEPVVVVLGANYERNRLAGQVNYIPQILKSASGVESVYTDQEMIDLISATYSGIRRNQFVAVCQRSGINAIGLSGIDGQVVKGKRNRGIRVIQNEKKKVVRDFSGKPVDINTDLLKDLLSKGFVPVLTIPILDETGNMINTENDDIVGLLSEKLEAHMVVQFIEAEGILDENGRLIEKVEPKELKILEQNASGRFKRKILGFDRIIRQGSVIRIVDGRDPDPIRNVLMGKGTIIFPQFHPNPSLTLPSEMETLVITSRKSDLYLERGYGTLVFDKEGREYLDCSGGWGVSILGHSHPELIRNICRQMGSIMTAPTNHRNSVREEFADKLLSFMPHTGYRIFFSNSGTEAIEAAIKFAVAATGRSQIISHVRGFHGRTLGSLSVTHNRMYRKPFEEIMNQNVKFIPINNLEKAKEVITEDTAAVIIEVIQGEGGVHVTTEEYLQGLQEICNRSGTLLIVDEIQTGMGRTGSFLAIERAGVNPDIICLAKGLGGGFPIGATIIRKDIEIPLGLHGSTFGGNPIACAAGLATLKIIEKENLVEEAGRKGQIILNELKAIAKEHPLIRMVRGRGLMIAIEFKKSNRQFIEKLLEQGILSIPTGRNIVRFLPPLSITEEEILLLIQGVKRALAEIVHGAELGQRASF